MVRNTFHISTESIMRVSEFCRLHTPSTDTATVFPAISATDCSKSSREFGFLLSNLEHVILEVYLCNGM